MLVLSLRVVPPGAERASPHRAGCGGRARTAGKIGTVRGGLVAARDRGAPYGQGTFMGTALAAIGFFALIGAVVVGVVALVRRLRHRPARRAGWTAAGLTGTALAMIITGTAVGIPTTSTTSAAGQPAVTPAPTATTPVSAAGPPTTTTPAPTGPAVVTTPPPTPTPTVPAPTATPAVVPVPAQTTARSATGPAAAALAALPVKGRAAKTGYSRDAFGPAWADVDDNGCDTRNDVLRRDLTDLVLTAGTGGCEVATGTLADPYSGTTIAFTRGVDTSSAVQIDHVVALSNAWQTGATTWTPETREAFANDPLNLLAVQGWLNEQKSDGDSATWLPPATAIRCAYVARQVAVKAKYGLWVTPPEQAATTRILTSCPAQALPTSGQAAVPAPDPTGPVESTPQPTATQTPDPQPTRTPDPVATDPAPDPVDSAGLDPRFSTCKAAIAAGYGPYTEGTDPEYDWYRDSDHDGTDCERP